MARGWQIVLGVLGALWAFFLVAITIPPKQALANLAAWGGVIASAWAIALGVAVFAVLTTGIMVARDRLRRRGGPRAFRLPPPAVVVLINAILALALGIAVGYITTYVFQAALKL